MQLITPTVENLASYEAYIDTQELLNNSKITACFLANNVELDEALAFGEILEGQKGKSQEKAREAVEETFELSCFSANDQAVLQLVLKQFFPQ